MPELATSAQQGELQASRPERQDGLFREAALNYLAAPDQIDTLMPVIAPRHWLALAGLGAIVGLALVWAVFGRIAMTVTGRGVLIRPGKVVALQATAAGQIKSLDIREGDYIRKGAVIGVVDQFGLRQELELERSKLAKQQAEYAAISALQERRALLEKGVQELRRKDLEERRQDTRSLADRLRTASMRSIDQQKENLSRALELSRAMSKIQSERMERSQKLQLRNASSPEQVKQEQLDHLQAIGKEVDLQGQLQALELRAEQVHDAYLEKLDKISEMTSQINETLIAVKRLEQQTLELTASHQLTLQETERNIARLELALERQSHIVSEHSGRVLELTATVGRVLEPGAKLATLLNEDQSSPLIGFCYFQVKDGKRIVAGMRARSALDSVKRERYGNLVGRVQAVTPFPVSAEGVINTIGNSEVARALVADERHIEVLTELQVDRATPSGYAWTSSRGPESRITVGTTANVEVEVESRAPISFLLPFLRQWTRP